MKATAKNYGMNYYNLETKGHNQQWLKRELQNALDNLIGKTVVVSLMGPVLFDLLDIFHELGINFPDDVGLVSFDDWSWSRYVQDGIYLMRQDVQLMGNVAARKLLIQIAQGTMMSSTTILPVKMVDRPSI